MGFNTWVNSCYHCLQNRVELSCAASVSLAPVSLLTPDNLLSPGQTCFVYWSSKYAVHILGGAQDQPKGKKKKK